MKITRMEFENFRSFGPRTVGIDFDEKLTIFVGKNNSGKSNIMRLLQELKVNRIPLNRTYVLNKANWYNNEAGVERPLKIKLILNIDSEDYNFFCKNWILAPLETAWTSLTEDFSEHLEAQARVDSLFPSWESTFHELMPRKDVICRLEFIRLSDTHQEMNYSVEFNDILAVSTNDGRNFIQTIHTDLPEKRFHERDSWESHLRQMLEIALKSFETQRTSDKKRFLQLLFEDPKKYIFSSQSLNAFYDRLFQFLLIADEDQISEPFLMNLMGKEREEKLQKHLISKLIALQNSAIDELVFENRQRTGSQDLKQTALNTSQSDCWNKYTQLLKRFEDIFDSLDITLTLEQTAYGKILRFYQRSTNTILFNSESIGKDILDRLYFLYQLIVNEDYFFLVDQPENHLHPHSQRLIYNLIKEYSEQHQMILITHSLFMFQPDDLLNLRIFTLSNGISTINKLDVVPDSFEYHQLRRNFTVRNRDAIFADGIVFVEGPSEEMTFPYFFKSYGLDLDLHNISLINIGGKGSFSVFKKFADQLQKKYWFFFDNDVMGLRAKDNITPESFRASIIWKHRHMFSPQIVELSEQLARFDSEEQIEFEENLELLRNLLQDHHIFVFQSDFEDIFENQLTSRIDFRGGKVEKAMMLESFLKEHEDEQWLPDELYRFIEMLQDDFKKR